MKIKPRDYQVEAVEWALREGRAVVCMPTGTGKTVVAGLWIKHLLGQGRARRVLVLEPTRFLVEQTARFLRERMGLDARPVHGSLPPGLRRRGWAARVVVATPEIVVAEWEEFVRQGFDAVVVDECHHTTGQDAYRAVVEGYEFRWRLGLTAYVPPSRRRLIEQDIGPVKCWSWEDERLARYIPPWEAEVYEAPLNEAEKRLYEALEKLWEEVEGHSRALVQMAIRWYVRDGLAALRESMANSRRLRELLAPLHGLLDAPGLREAHKLPALRRVLDDHEGFDKAIVFIDRIVVAKLVVDELREYSPVLVAGRRHAPRPAETLEKAKSPETRIVVSTSAGEEGIDLPEASLLVVWSHTASPLRFIQRHGRILRAVAQHARRHKWVVYIVTPETVDVDSLVDGILEARKAGVHVNIDPGIVEYVWSLSRRRRVLELLEQAPLDEELAAKALGMPLERLREALRWLTERGLVGYIYTHLGKTYFAQASLEKLYESYSEYLDPNPSLTASITPLPPEGGRQRTIRGTYHRVLARLESALARHGWLRGICASVQVEAGKGLLRLLNLHYGFRIEDMRVLKTVVDNIYSAEKFADYL